MLRKSNGLLRGWMTQSRVIRALMLRDMMARYGRDNIGFVWVVLEAMILTVGVMIVWSLGAGPRKDGIKIVEFVLTGYLPLTLWRHLTNPMVMVFRRSVPLLFHRSVSLLDIVLARILLEFIATSAAFLLVWGILNVSGVVADINSLSLLLAGWVSMAWLAGALGMILAVVTERLEASERFVQPFQYLMIPMSGAFALVDWLPDWAQPLMLLNPTVHCYEAIRAGFFGPSIVTHYSLYYVCIWAFALTFIGLMALRRVRDHVQLS